MLVFLDSLHIEEIDKLDGLLKRSCKEARTFGVISANMEADHPESDLVDLPWLK